MNASELYKVGQLEPAIEAQVAKVKEEMNISRRLAWQRKGLMADQKGAEQLLQKNAAYSAPPKQPQYDLNAEVSSDGSYRILPPQTNSAPMPR